MGGYGRSGVGVGMSQQRIPWTRYDNSGRRILTCEREHLFVLEKTNPLWSENVTCPTCGSNAIAGDCFREAFKLVLTSHPNGGMELVLGRVWNGGWIKHAWGEMDGMIYDPARFQILTKAEWQREKPVFLRRWTREEMIERAKELGFWITKKDVATLSKNWIQPFFELKAGEARGI